ncbi:MAG TPA: hypothetical protein VKB20_11830 [Steroidobacteraceae bacterium]|nr:hypothetical protein [Steroidobacteraceae bacterium]
MAIIQRPTKQGNATTYQGKVAAGYTKILAAEVDADLDLLYSAWNAGVDAVNIKPGAIQGSNIASGSISSTQIQAGGILTASIGDAQITTVKLANASVTAAKLGPSSVTTAAIAPGAVTLAQLGPDVTTAGGDLTGSYPAPLVNQISRGWLEWVPRGSIYSDPNWYELHANAQDNVGYDPARSSWITRLNYTADTFEVWRAPPGSTAFTMPFWISKEGWTHCTLAPLTVGRTQLAVNSVLGQANIVNVPSNWSISSPGWQTFQQLLLTTRGGAVMLWACGGLSAMGPLNGAIVSLRWLWNGNQLVQDSCMISSSDVRNVAAIPNLNWAHVTPPAGNHVYTYQVYAEPGITVFSSAAAAAGAIMALEIG